MSDIIATLGFILAAKFFKDRKKETYTNPEPPVNNNFDFNFENVMATKSGDDSGIGMNPFNKQEMPSFGVVGFMKHVNGEPVQDFRDRPYVSGKMNNFSSIEKNLVGPGLNVGPDVSSYGGFQQLFRVKPNNVGAYRLTTLPGRSGPAVDVSGGRRGVVGELTHNKPETTSYLPSRYPSVKGRAQGQGGSLNGVVPRGKYQKTTRPTNRSETTLRSDGLEFGGANMFISSRPLSDEPTRNKGDLNVINYAQPSPGVSNYYGGYTNSPAAKALKDGNLQLHGLRVADKKGQRDRPSNPGRMNVRGNPVNQNGMITSVRSDTSRVDGWFSPPSGGYTQNYVKPMYQHNNSFKGNKNPYSSANYLNTAVDQLKKNPFAHSLSG